MTRLFRTIAVTLFLLLIPAAMTGCSSPKVSVSAVSISPAKTSPDRPITAAVNVLSYDKKPVDYTVTFKVDNALKQTKNVEIAAGETETVSFEYQAPLGSYTVEINGQKATFQVVKPAEFSVGPINIESGALVTGKEATIKTEVSNIGELSGNYTARLLVNGTEAASTDVVVEPGASTTVSMRYKPETNGSCKLSIGPATQEARVYKAASFETSSLTVSPSSVFVGQSATVEVTIKNTGEVAGSCPVVLTSNGSEAGSQSVVLEPEASQKVSFTVSPRSAGTQSLKVFSASGSLTATELKSYTNRIYAYKVSYPPDYTVSDKNPVTVQMASPGSGGLTVLVDPQPIAGSAKAYFDSMVQGKKRQLPDFTILSQAEVTENGVAVGFRYDYSNTVDGIKWQGKGLVLKRGGLGYYVVFTFPESDWERQKSLAPICLDSFATARTFTASYTGVESGFNLSNLGDWTLLETGSAAPQALLVPPYGKPNVLGQVGVETAPAGTTALQYVTGVRQALSAKGYSVSAETPFSFAQGPGGYEFTVTAGSISERLIVLVAENKACLLMFAGLSGDLSSLSGDIGQVARSLTVSNTATLGLNKNETLYLLGGEIPTMDPAITEDAPGDYIGAIFSGLVKLDKDLKVVTDLAERWTLSPDGKTYTFYLRPNAKFHDGRQVTASDVKYSWERACDPATKSPKAGSFLNDIVGAKDMMAGKANSISGIRVIDTGTVEVTLDAAKQYFLGKIALPVAYIVDKGNVQQGANWYQKPNGTGPFKVKEWVKDTRLVLERNDTYYGTPAKLKNLAFQLFAGNSMTLYENGEIDLTGVATNNLDKVLDTSNPLNKDLKVGNGMMTSYIGMNMNKAPFDDLKVRQAFAQALDVNKIIEVSMKGKAERAAGYVPPGVPGSNSALQPIAFDPARAKQLIAESKYKSVDQLPPVTLYVLYQASPADQAAVGMWQQNLGVQVKIETVSTYEDYMARMHNREFQMVVRGWGADYVDPQDFLDVLFQSQSPENVTGYSNAAVDAALVDAAAEKDEAARIRKYQEIEKTILADLPGIPYYQNSKVYVLVKPYVTGYMVTPVNINLWSEINVTAH